MDTGDAGRRQNAGGYLKITNNGTSADRFAGAKSDAADLCRDPRDVDERWRHEDAAMPDGLEIKPGETVELKSGGYHLMFMDLSSRSSKAIRSRPRCSSRRPVRSR